MLKVAVSASGPSMESNVPATFEETTHLLIIDADAEVLLDTLDSGEKEPMGRSMYFAQKVVDLDCEALLCGVLEPEPFAVLAEENSVTRYLAADLSANESIRMMKRYALALITDYIGGTGCPDADPANCEHHHDHES